MQKTNFGSLFENGSKGDLLNTGDVNASELIKLDKELDKNVKILDDQINNFFDQISNLLEEKKSQLLLQLENVKREKQQNNRADKGYVDNGHCLRFSVNEEIFNAIGGCASIDDRKAFAKTSSATGVGLRYGLANEPTKFSVKTCNSHGDTSWVEQDLVEASIEKDGVTHHCIVRNKCNGTYNVYYDVEEAGRYKINVTVNGNSLNDCPFQCRVFEKQDLKFKVEHDSPELQINNGEKTAFLQKFHRSSKLYSNAGALARAWKVRVTTACTQIKLKFGYCYNTPLIPALMEEYVCKFDLNKQKIVPQLQQFPLLSGNHRRHHHRQRKQSTFQRTSLTFVVIEDVDENLIHVAIEGTDIMKTTTFKGDSQMLIPFIGVKHFCENSSCPRPTLVYV